MIEMNPEKMWVFFKSEQVNYQVVFADNEKMSIIVFFGIVGISIAVTSTHPASVTLSLYLAPVPTRCYIHLHDLGKNERNNQMCTELRTSELIMFLCGFQSVLLKTAVAHQ